MERRTLTPWALGLSVVLILAQIAVYPDAQLGLLLFLAFQTQFVVFLLLWVALGPPRPAFGAAGQLPRPRDVHGRPD